MAKRKENGVSPAKRMTNNFKFREKPKNIATIDFGTTHCSVAYKLNADVAPEKEKPEILKLDESGPLAVRVPSCIVFDSEGKRLYFGYQAREHYYRMDHAQRPNCIYFEHIKMKLQHDKSVGRNQKVEALNGKEYFLIDVIAHILCHLKEQLLRVVRDFGLDYDATDFDWVITVPAIWKAKGKTMMREAGYKAGLCSVKSPPALKETDDIGFSPSTDNEQSLDKLSLALEPESAALYCQQEAEEAKKAADGKYLPKSEHYLLLDIGGGTVDIATHSLAAGGIVELVSSTGNDFGGTRVNQNYETFLGNFVDDPGFSRYLNVVDENKRVRHRAEITNLLYTEFESQKLQFGSQQSTTQSFKIVFPLTFWRTYEEEIMEGGRKGERGIQIEDDGSVMRIMSEKMAQFFQPIVTGITDLIKSHITSNNLVDTIDTVYLVGGFGGCSYLHKQIEMELKSSMTETLSYAVPLNPNLATVYGATMFRCNPGIVRQRKADASYGLGCAIRFDASIHRRDYKYWSEDEQAYNCSNLFMTFVEKGEFICTNEVFVTKYGTNKMAQKSMTVNMYSAPRKDVWYITDDEVYKLGTITVDMEGYGLDREVEFVLDITHTELQLLARDKSSPDSCNECKIVVDFLSSER